MKDIINKTMDRSDLLTDEAKPVIRAINNLIETLYSKNLYMTSWYGTLPKRKKLNFNKAGIKNLVEIIARKRKEEIGMDNRGSDYEPLPYAVDDGRIPWYLYWEIFWVLENGPKIETDMRVLDAGGTSSLFTCFLASLGVEIHSVDINKELLANGNKIAEEMGWKMFSYEMNMKELAFEDGYFDHAYSICVFEHLTYEIKQVALSEIARTLKPNGTLSITFDYKNPAPAIAGFGPDISKENRLSTEDDIKRNFLSDGCFELLGNQNFYDNGKTYLIHQEWNNIPYTFGAIFLKKRG